MQRLYLFYPGCRIVPDRSGYIRITTAIIESTQEKPIILTFRVSEFSIKDVFWFDQDEMPSPVIDFFRKKLHFVTNICPGTSDAKMGISDTLYGYANVVRHFTGTICHMLKRIDKAIDDQSEEDLRACIADLYNDPKEISTDFYPVIEKLLVDRWHHEHEDIVAMVWLKDLKDNRFVNPILAIAEQGDVYRPFDDELESTLRKCVHALKTIGTEESNLAVERILRSGNENVKYALENYK